MAGQLLDKVAVVTGGASGIGRATALRFATEGASIVIGDLDATRGEETTTAIRANGGSVIFVRTDTTSEADCDALADAAMQEFGRLDVCLAAAGIYQQIDSVTPKPPSSNNRYPETRVEVRLKGTTLRQLVQLLHKIETGRLYLIVRSLRITTRGQEQQVLDVSFSVSSFERA